MIRLLAASVATLALLGMAAPAAARPFTQQDLIALDRVSDPRISPDGRIVVYDLATLNAKGTGRNHAIMAVAADGAGAAVKLTEGSSARWAPGGGAIYYLKDGQVFSLALCVLGHECRSARQPRQVTKLPTDVDSFRISPDGKLLAVSMAVIPGQEGVDAIKKTKEAMAAKLSSGMLYDRIFVRHWDTWSDHTKNHLFVLSLGADGLAQGDPLPLTKDFDGDVPSKPFGDDGDYAFWPGSHAVVFSAREAGKSEPWSTNFDLYAADDTRIANRLNMTSANKGWDASPTFSDDGSILAYRAQKRAGFEADRFAVMVGDAKSEQGREVAPTWDRSADQIAFSGDGKSLYVSAADVQTERLFKMNIATGKVEPLTTGGHVGGFDVAHPKGGDVLVFTRDSMAGAPQIYVLKPGGQPVQLTHVNEAALKGVEMSPYESFEFPGWNNETVHGWIVKPAGYKPGQKFPTVMLIHGGPQGSWEDSWSNRWNPQVWAGWGYGVVMVDFHGSTGYGQAFTDAISGHWGDRPLEDLQKGWAAAQVKAPWIDASNACAAGASYGGYMTYWIAGVWNTPWKCLIDHDGVFDNRIMGYATEELWFSEWENGHATPWEKPENYEVFNPVNHVKDWTKPMLVIHSAKDYRIPLEQGLGAFTAMQRKGIDSQFLTFPDENHWVLKPQNSLQWHNEVFHWLDDHLKPQD